MSLRTYTKLLQDALAMPTDTEAHKLATQLSEQLETALTQMGLDASELYHMSRSDQTALIEQVTDKVLSDQSVGELARLVGRGEETANDLFPERADTALENFPQKDTIGLERTKHAEDRSKERTVEDHEIQDALSNPLFVGEAIVDEFGRKSVRYIGNDATVVINPDTGGIITVWNRIKGPKKVRRE